METDHKFTYAQPRTRVFLTTFYSFGLHKPIPVSFTERGWAERLEVGEEYYDTGQSYQGVGLPRGYGKPWMSKLVHDYIAGIRSNGDETLKSQFPLESIPIPNLNAARRQSERFGGIALRLEDLLNQGFTLGQVLISGNFTREQVYGATEVLDRWGKEHPPLLYTRDFPPQPGTVNNLLREIQAETDTNKLRGLLARVTESVYDEGIKGEDDQEPIFRTVSSLVSEAGVHFRGATAGENIRRRYIAPFIRALEPFIPIGRLYKVVESGFHPRIQTIHFYRADFTLLGKEVIWQHPRLPRKYGIELDRSFSVALPKPSHGVMGCGEI